MVARFLLDELIKLRNSVRSLVVTDGLDELVSGDPDNLLLNGETKQEREQRLAIEKHQARNRTQKKDQHEKDERDFFVTILILQEQQRLNKELLADIADAKKVVTLAYGHALQAQAAAIEGFDQARRNAIVLPDGRRVYFARDGRHLYAENLESIADAATLAEAHQRQNSERTSYEDYYARLMERRKTTESMEQLEGALSALDEIEQHIGAGTMTADELLKARQDTGKIIEGLPSEIRAEYGRIRAARSAGQEPAYRAAEESVSSFPTVNADFFRAVNHREEVIESPEPDKSNNRAPAFRSVPEF